MRSFSARRLLLACIVSASAAAALVAPGVANAFKPETVEACKGVSIGGNGSTLQELAQHSFWTKGFNEAALEAEGACNAKGTPAVTYTGTGSGPGMTSWGFGRGVAHTGNFEASNEFVGTDEPPNLTQKEEIEGEGTGGKLLEIPTLQAAVAIAIHLPTGCTAKSKVDPGRLALTAAQVEGLLRGTITNWLSLKSKEDKLKGKKGACNAAIKRVVRKEDSGTTAITKKFLNIVNEAPVSEGKTWKQLGEENPNTHWPEQASDPVVEAKGGGGVAETVANTPSTVGYANLADVRSKFNKSAKPTGAGTSIFWAEVENSPENKAVKPHRKATYADPATNGESPELAQSNCAGTLYTDGINKFPPTTVEKPWNEVTTSLEEPNYPICGFTYDLSLSKYKGYGVASLKEAKVEGARTAFDFFNFMMHGGQKQIEGKTDYESLPENVNGHVLAIARAGAEKISFE
jgi:ABC-type phosphate transport system substrate-binding protein